MNIFTKKTKQNKTKNKKTIKKVYKRKTGGSVLDFGSEGCILDSIICSDSIFRNDKYVAKLYKMGVKNDYHLIYEILRRNDPYEERYAIYHEQNLDKCSVPEHDMQKCETLLKSKIDKSYVFFTKKT